MQEETHSKEVLNCTVMRKQKMWEWKKKKKGGWELSVLENRPQTLEHLLLGSQNRLVETLMLLAPAERSLILIANSDLFSAWRNPDDITPCLQN